MDPALAKEVAILANMRTITEAIEKGDSEVQKFYKDTTLLISGGSGFMGKQLLEKIFRSCEIKKVFLLMRPKKNKELRERLDIMLEDSVFDTVKKMRPGFEKKICPVRGDVAEPRLGITSEDHATIIAETNIIIHAAATVNFDEALKTAINTNVRGTFEMLKLGKQCKKLKSYVHVSTAYSHATISRINKLVAEQFYEAPLTPQVAMEMVEALDEKVLKDITPKLIKDWPNTYTFTKAIAEEAVRQVGSELPICIVRPSIVIASLLEPSPGWLDMSCAFGASGFVLGSTLGVFHTLLSDGKKKQDYVPVDLANNAIILAGWETAKKREQGEYEQQIYNLSSNRNTSTVEFTFNYLTSLRDNYVSPKSLYFVFMLFTSNPIIYFILNWLFHYIPGYIVDFVLRITGRKPLAVKLYTKMNKLATVLSYFMMNDWVFDNKNLLAMSTGLNATDKKIYNCDLASFDWKEMLLIWVLGVRKYIIKDGLQGTEQAVKKSKWIKLLHYTVVTPLYFYLLYKVAMLAFTLVYFAFSSIIMVISFFL